MSTINSTHEVDSRQSDGSVWTPGFGGMSVNDLTLMGGRGSRAAVVATLLAFVIVAAVAVAGWQLLG